MNTIEQAREVVRRLSIGSSIARDRRIDHDFAGLADAACIAMEMLIAELAALKGQEPVAWGIVASNTGRICQVELDAAEVEGHKQQYIRPLFLAAGAQPVQQEPKMPEFFADYEYDSDFNVLVAVYQRVSDAPPKLVQKMQLVAQQDPINSGHPDDAGFELWWSEHMPEAVQSVAIGAWNAAQPTVQTQEQQEQYTYATKQATTCASCGEHKHTPLRIDAMGGYVCLTCIDKKLGLLLVEFGYAAPVQAVVKESLTAKEQL